MLTCPHAKIDETLLNGGGLFRLDITVLHRIPLNQEHKLEREKGLNNLYLFFLFMYGEV